MKNIFQFIGRYFTFICFIGLQIVCIVMLSKYSETHEAFFGAAANEFTGKVNAQVNNFYAYFSLKQINKELTNENARLKNNLQSSFVAPDSSQRIVIDTLVRDSSNHQYRKYFWLPAAIVGNTVTSQTNYLTIERGNLQGVTKGMSVIGPQGIVGVVISTSDNYSIAMSLLHRNSKVSVMLKKDKTSGSVEWDGVDPHFLILKNISKSTKLAKGDTIVTSTYSANFPPYQMVGTIATISTDPSSNFYVLKIKSATNFYNIQYVYLVDNIHYAEQTKLESFKLKTNE